MFLDLGHAPLIFQKQFTIMRTVITIEGDPIMGSIVSTQSLKNDEFVRIGHCGQGTIYVVIGALSLRLEREAFLELSRKFDQAAHALGGLDARGSDTDTAFRLG
jgi:hypothetical protein